MNKQRKIDKKRQRRRYHNRAKLRGTPERPRLCVHRTLKHIACQVIDDTTGRTIVSVSSKDGAIRGDIGYGGNCDAATKIGKLLAEKALDAGIKEVRFDRGHGRYHGRIAALANGAREGGLVF